MMMHKNCQWADCPRLLQLLLEEQETKNQIESTDGVPAQDPPKVKSVNEKSLRTLSWKK